jgi:hypothetical protein
LRRRECAHRIIRIVLVERFVIGFHVLGSLLIRLLIRFLEFRQQRRKLQRWVDDNARWDLPDNDHGNGRFHDADGHLYPDGELGEIL